QQPDRLACGSGMDRGDARLHPRERVVIGHEAARGDPFDHLGPSRCVQGHRWRRTGASATLFFRRAGIPALPDRARGFTIFAVSTRRPRPLRRWPVWISGEDAMISRKLGAGIVAASMALPHASPVMADGDAIVGGII